jgi:hypothetical protein
MQTLNQFIAKHGITAECQWADRNPNMDDKEWSRDSTHYRVTLTIRDGKRRRKMQTYFSMGSAHTKEPSAADVLDCLASDASGYDNAQSFEEWARDYGYDPDSRKAEKTYKTIAKQSERLKQWLGNPDEYQHLLFDTERL